MKPGRWWRAQNASVDHTKLLLLSDKAFRNWYSLMCVASENEGALPGIQHVALKLRTTPARAAAAITELVRAELFDKREDGTFVPHDWDEWQFKNDAIDPTATERQRRKREKDKRERDELLALRDAVRNGVTNGVTNCSSVVMASRAETDTYKTTSTVSVERGSSFARKLSTIPVSPEFAATMAGKK